MTPRFVFRPAAVAELREARDWYEAQRVGLGFDLGEVIDGTLQRIAANPDAFPEVMPGVRRAVIARFPYGIFYRGLGEGIEVLAVFHHRRDPAIWAARAAV
jgi:plasmid stabilization system protein ParE